METFLFGVLASALTALLIGNAGQGLGRRNQTTNIQHSQPRKRFFFLVFRYSYPLLYFLTHRPPAFSNLQCHSQPCQRFFSFVLHPSTFLAPGSQPPSLILKSRIVPYHTHTIPPPFSPPNPGHPPPPPHPLHPPPHPPNPLLQPPNPPPPSSPSSPSPLSTALSIQRAFFPDTSTLPRSPSSSRPPHLLTHNPQPSRRSLFLRLRGFRIFEIGWEWEVKGAGGGGIPLLGFSAVPLAPLSGWM